MINALCIDLEPWYSAELVKRHLSKTKDTEEDQIIESVTPILNLLDRYNTRATFAVLGIVAEQHPELVRAIYGKGHEIASHAYSHATLHELGKEKFEEEIGRSVKLLESITGEKPIGFRAPSFSIDNSTKWAFEILRKHGFKYDASIFPIRTRLYGMPKAPLHIYRPSMDDITQENPGGEIIEFPMTVLRLGWNIPVAGGFYLRALPLRFLKWTIKKVNQTRPAIIYVHPWETYPKTPRLRKVSLFSKLVTYYGVGSALGKLEGLLQEFRFQPVCQVIALNFNPDFQKGCKLQ